MANHDRRVDAVVDTFYKFIATGLAIVGIYALMGGFHETKTVEVEKIVYQERPDELLMDFSKAKVGDFIVWVSSEGKKDYSPIVDLGSSKVNGRLLGFSDYGWGLDPEPIATSTKKANGWVSESLLKENKNYYLLKSNEK